MRQQTVTLIMIALAVMAFSGDVSAGGSKFTLVVTSDPSGANVEDAKLGTLGQTPLEIEYEVKSKRNKCRPGFLGKSTANCLYINISKRGYIGEAWHLVINKKQKRYVHHVDLYERQEFAKISSDPEGAAVYLVFIPGRRYAVASAEDKKEMRTPCFEVKGKKTCQDSPELVKRYLGSTPINLVEDPQRPLADHDLLVFEKAGYEDGELTYREKEPAHHKVMHEKPELAKKD